MLVIYRQVTVFLAWFQESFGNKAWKLLCRPSLVAFFVVCRFDLILQSGTYMVAVSYTHLVPRIPPALMILT